MCRSLCSVKFEAYHGALVMGRRVVCNWESNIKLGLSGFLHNQDKVFHGFTWLWILTLSLNFVKKIRVTYKAGKSL